MDGDDRVLAERAKAGDRDAFAELYRAHVERIHAFAYRRTRSRDAAEDITASTFERAWRALPSFQWRGGGFGAWLYRIAANEIVSHFRRTGAHVVAVTRDTASGTSGFDAVEDELTTGPRRAAVLRALATINPRYQEAITLRYFAEMDTEEAAQAMGVSRGTMAVLLHRSMSALRKAVDLDPHWYDKDDS